MEINFKRSSNISGEQVAYDGNLSTEILLRLPIQSILRSKCVSKLWLSLITNPSFSLLHAKRQPNPNSPSGLFLQRRSNLSHQEYDFVPFNVENPVRPPFKTLSFDKEASTSGISVLQSVNGLMLCHSMCVSLRKHTLVYNPKYYVYNPTLHQFTTLPKFDGWISRRIRGMSLVFDPSISIHFTVVCVRSIELSLSNYYQIDFYSSETGKWRVSGTPFPYELEKEFMGGVYWNGSVHWLSKDASVSYLNLDEERMDHIPAPNNGSNFERIYNRLLKSQDSLLLIDVFDLNSSEFDVFEMKRDYSGWLLKYKVDLLNVSHVFPEMHLHGYIFAVHCLVLGKKEEDSFVLIEIPGKAIRYNLKLKTFYKLCDFPLPPAGNEFSSRDMALVFGRWVLGRVPGAFLFTESLSVVSHTNNTWGL